MASNIPVDILHLIAEYVADSVDCQYDIHSCCRVNSSFYEAFVPFLFRHVCFQPPLKKLRTPSGPPAQDPKAIDQDEQARLLMRLSQSTELHRVNSFQAVL